MYLLFDIDGTLIRANHAGRRAVEAALRELYGTVPSTSIPFSGRTDQFIFRALLEAIGTPADDQNFEQLAEAYLRHLPNALAACRGTVLPGVTRLLETLVADGRFTLGLLTGNLPASARAKLAHFGLEHFFDFGVFGDHSHDRCELAAEAVALLQRRFGESPAHRIWVIGDTPFDIACGRHIGARTLGCGTGGESLQSLRDAGAEHVFATLDDTEQLLEIFQSVPDAI